MMAKKLLILFLFCHVASPAQHSLKYFLTATSGMSNFPEFVGAAMVDEVLLGYCDSNIKLAEPKQDWLKDLMKNEPEHMKWYTSKCFDNQQVFRANIEGLKIRLNQTGGVHILQRMNGCEWDTETGEVTGFNQYAYDGEDFLALDLQTLTWVAPNPKALLTKFRWDADKARLDYNKYYYLHKCPEWLRKYVYYGKNFLERTEHPSVSLLQRTPSSPVSCFATGFFPDRAMMFWRKDGEELHQDVEMGELLPNHDGTFQMSVDLNAPSEEDWGSYDCVLHLSGVTDDIITKLDIAAIRTNWVSPSEFPAGCVFLGVFGLVLLLAAAGLFAWRRRNIGFSPVNAQSRCRPWFLTAAAVVGAVVGGLMLLLAVAFFIWGRN